MTRRSTKPKAEQPSVPLSKLANILAMYDAAGMGRRMRGWNPPNSGPNKAIAGLERIRARSRDARRNDWTGHAGVQRWATTLVGVGITPRFKRIADKKRRQEIVDLFNDFVKESDADHVLNYYGQQTLVVKTWFDAGECFGRFRPRDFNAPLSVPLQIQLIESDFVPMLDADAYPGLPEGHRIRSGIELNRYGRRVAYWMYREHPNDSTGLKAIDSTKLIRVAASEVLHIYEPDRPGALRGVSNSAPILARLRNVADFEDAALERQKLANLFVAFIKRELPTLADGDFDPLTNAPLKWDGGDTPIAAMEPGITQELLPGEDVVFANPPEAGTTYSEYMRTNHMGTAAGMDLPYEILSGDIKEVSDRTLRVIINEFRRLAEQRQWQIIIPQFCQKVIERFAEMAYLVGKVTLEEMEAIKRCEHAPHGWAHIHPVQDPQGKKLEVDAGFRSRSSVIGERGDDPDLVDEERAEDLQREKDLDLYVDPMAQFAPTPEKDEGDQDGIDDDEYSAPPNAVDRAYIELMSARRRQIESQMNSPPAVPTPAPSPKAVQRTVIRDKITGVIQSIIDTPVITEEN